MAHMLPRSYVFILEIGAARVGFVIRIRSSLSGKHTIQACSGPRGRTTAMITLLNANDGPLKVSAAEHSLDALT
jgi:hypothetical protein